MSQPLTVIATYRVKKESEDAFRKLLDQHWPTLRQHDLASEAPPLVFRGEEEDGLPFFVEIFSWRDETASDTAHELPEVLSIWEPMAQLCEERQGKPSMDFPHVEPIQLHL